MRYAVFIAVTGLAALGAPGLTQTAQAPDLPVLASIQPGMWSLTSRADPSENRNICVADPHALLQVRHNGSNCNRFVISSGPKEATVHYTCPGAGHGRTTLRAESPRLVQIESQGIANKSPFAVTLEGRRTGNCGLQKSALRR